jgi:serine protease Do
MISKQSALLNEVPQGAYVQSIIAGSPAEKAGIKIDDIITEIDGKKLSENETEPLASYISKKKIGDNVTVKIWRDKQDLTVTVKLEKKI